MTAINAQEVEAVIERAVRFAMAALHLPSCPADENVNLICECGKEEAIDLLREMAGADLCEFCGQRAPDGQFHPYWHDEGNPMRACDECVKCEHCDGTGKHESIHPAWDEDPCEDCGGSGLDSCSRKRRPNPSGSGSEATP